jgi:osmotically inducible protein OsmC
MDAERGYSLYDGYKVGILAWKRVSPQSIDKLPHKFIYDHQEEHSMTIRTADAYWEGSLKDGKGKMSLGSGTFEGAYSFSSRFEEGKGTNPEELIGAAHAGCYSMALSSELGKIGLTPQSIHTRAQVTLGKIGDNTRITLIHLETEVRLPGISPEQFHDIAEATKTSCPVSAALASVPITLDAKLII